MTHPPGGLPAIVPYLHYDDVSAAADWLAKAFGLSLVISMPGSDGSVMHAEMSLGKGVIMMGPPNPAIGAVSPRGLPGMSQSLYVYVDDVEAHHRQAVASGARVLKAPADMFWGDRIYAALDCEGHHWVFAQHVRDVDESELRPPQG